MEQTVLKEFQEEISEMDRDDIRLKTIREWEKYRERKEKKGSRYPKSSRIMYGKNVIR